jgi:hypothetical protein
MNRQVIVDTLVNTLIDQQMDSFDRNFERVLNELFTAIPETRALKDELYQVLLVSCGDAFKLGFEQGLQLKSILYA